MADRSFKLSARISSSNPEAIRPVIKRLIKAGTVKEENDEFLIEANMKGASAKELNRSLLSELRRAEKKTRLRAVWTYGKTSERYFDYVMKKKEES